MKLLVLRYKKNDLLIKAMLFFCLYRVDHYFYCEYSIK